MIMDLNEFNYVVGDTIRMCQQIENDVKWIYAFMHKGNTLNNYNYISGFTLSQTVKILEELDNSDNNPYLSDSDYNLLRSLTEERNYIVHTIFTDFIYTKNFLESKDYREACSKLENFHKRLDALWKNVEDSRLLAANNFKDN